MNLVTDALVRADQPYRDSGELLADVLRLAKDRATVVRDAHNTLGAWTPQQLAAEALIAGRTRASGAHAVPLARLHATFGLSATEQRVLWALIAHELCSATRALHREINTEQCADPTTDTILHLAYGDAAHGAAAWGELSPDAPLRRLTLIERTDGNDATPRHRQTWKVAVRVLALVHGDVDLDPAIARLAVTVSSAPGRDLVYAHGLDRRVSEACDRDGIVIVYGGPSTGRRSILMEEAAKRGRRLIEIDGRAIAKERDAAQRELRLIAREVALLGLVPLIRGIDALGASGNVEERLDLVESEMKGLVVATSNRAVARHWRRPATQVELPPLTGQQRAQVWRAALKSATDQQAEDLATLYPLAPGLIHTAGALVTMACGAQPPTADQIGDALRSILDDRLLGLARRVAVTQVWDDMVLPEDQHAAIVELMSRIRKRRTVYEDWGFADKLGKGLGVSALFSGPPGTGKTMAAGLIARELGVELYQVDMSKITSKWIGETEKNLAAVFDAAEAGHAILLFDEADSMFAKRTEVKSSNDRYANQEVNFLLQRLESYAGIVILTTNHETAIDEAFRRRLSIRVQFPMPEAEERTKLWRTLLPKNAPTRGQLGIERLAEHYVMSGGYIRNAVLRAAFLAAAEGAPITAAHLSSAAQLEYEAMGKVAQRL